VDKRFPFEQDWASEFYDILLKEMTTNPGRQGSTWIKLTVSSAQPQDYVAIMDAFLHCNPYSQVAVFKTLEQLPGIDVSGVQKAIWTNIKGKEPYSSCFLPFAAKYGDAAALDKLVEYAKNEIKFVESPFGDAKLPYDALASVTDLFGLNMGREDFVERYQLRRGELRYDSDRRKYSWP